MWIRKYAWTQWTKDVAREIVGLRNIISDKDSQVAGLRNQVHDLGVALAAARAKTETVIQSTVEERIEAAAAKAYADLLRVRVNHLELQNADLFSRVLAGYRVPTPQVTTDAVMPPPGVDFEDMGDEMAAKMGYADAVPVTAEPLPQSTIVPYQDYNDGLERVDDPTLLSGLEDEG